MRRKTIGGKMARWQGGKVASKTIGGKMARKTIGGKMPRKKSVVRCQHLNSSFLPPPLLKVDSS